LSAADRRRAVRHDERAAAALLAFEGFAENLTLARGEAEQCEENEWDRITHKSSFWRRGIAQFERAWRAH
jgi:hypothetical protein